MTQSIGPETDAGVESTALLRLRQAIVDARYQGWRLLALGPQVLGPTSFSRICAALGGTSARRDGSHIDVLSPVCQDQARSNSLSSRHGRGVFPVHVDGAHMPIPPRFVVLYCKSITSGHPTVIQEWSSVVARLGETRRLEREVFTYRSGRWTFNDPVLSRRRAFVRFDPGCMVSATRYADDLLRDLITATLEAPRREVRWTPGLVLVVDNWKMLHGRGEPLCAGKRVLFRSYVDHPIELGPRR